MTKRKERTARTISSTGLFHKFPAEREGKVNASPAAGEKNKGNREADTTDRMLAVVTHIGGKITPYGGVVS
ncbi:MAG: hypothetical protein OXS28_17815 [Gammaproteobacteria bacterium]|nr:hypothetical protein [Gammaproteobacteria bacterium]MDE0283210.1 hypothetical protein [Gammaproteobacteria bacterium]